MKTAYLHLQDSLKQLFGYSSFRPGQEEIIRHLLSGKDVLSIMPTGAGKSICFQLPACLFNGLTLVISPLISLMKDQVDRLKRQGIAAEQISNNLTIGQFRNILKNAQAGRYRLLYVTPERLQTKHFLDFVQKMNISMLVIDEAHCVSKWGQSFRPQYLKIYDFIKQLHRRPVVAAFTATATPRVQDDIIYLLGLRNPVCRVTTFDRPNLHLSVMRNTNKQKTILKLLKRHQAESVIIYCGTRKETEELCSFLCYKGFSATRYHAGLSNEERRQNQTDFLEGHVWIMIATNAFGMGIDKPDIRVVIHYQMPTNLEFYYQEIGRAGRDGLPSQCILLYSEKDIALCRYFLEHTDYHARDPEEIWKRRNWDYESLKWMILYATSFSCLRQQILHYFGEEIAPCGNCDNCKKMKNSKTFDLKEDPVYWELRLFRKKYWWRHPLRMRVFYRKKVLAELCYFLPDSKEKFLNISGFTLKTWEVAGESVLEIIKRRQESAFELLSE